MPFDRDACGGELCGDLIRNEVGRDGKPGETRPTEREETTPGQRHCERGLPRSRFAEDARRGCRAFRPAASIPTRVARTKLAARRSERRCTTYDPPRVMRRTTCDRHADCSPPRALRDAIKIPARFRVRGSRDIATAADMHSAVVARHYAAASFSFFSARAFTRTLAGFAGNQRSSPVNGSLPKRFFFAGTTCAVIFSRPGSVNSPAPFL